MTVVVIGKITRRTGLNMDLRNVVPIAGSLVAREGRARMLLAALG